MGRLPGQTAANLAGRETLEDWAFVWRALRLYMGRALRGDRSEQNRLAVEARAALLDDLCRRAERLWGIVNARRMSRRRRALREAVAQLQLPLWA